MWLVCFDILKIANWICTVSVIIYNNSSLSSGSRYCKPEVISWWKVNIRVFYTRFLSPTGQKCAKSSAFWQFFYYCPPSRQEIVKTWEEIVKTWCQEFDIYLLANIYTYGIYRYRYHTLGKRYGFSLSVQPDITSLLRPVFFFFFSMFKKMFLKSWQSVISWRSG